MPTEFVKAIYKKNNEEDVLCFQQNTLVNGQPSVKRSLVIHNNLEFAAFSNHIRVNDSHFKDVCIAIRNKKGNIITQVDEVVNILAVLLTIIRLSRKKIWSRR